MKKYIALIPLIALISGIAAGCGNDAPVMSPDSPRDSCRLRSGKPAAAFKPLPVMQQRGHAP